MLVFDVFLNGRKLCRAGVGPAGVLTAFVTWAASQRGATPSGRGSRPYRTKPVLQVGGLAEDTHRNWCRRMLGTGDRVTIRVTRADAFDPPASEEPRDPELVRREERKYYLRLKRRFERERKAPNRKQPRRRTRACS